MRPILLPFVSVNHSAPSDPAAMKSGSVPVAGTGYSVKAPEVVTRPILPAPHSVNQSAPSKPDVMLVGLALAVGMAYSRIAPELAPAMEVGAPAVGGAPAELPTLPHAASVETRAKAAKRAFTVVNH